MISIIDSGKLVNTDASPMVPRSVEMVGLSGDTKPTGVSVGNGWSFIEMDTGKVFFYNAEDEEWLEFAGSGGGGGQGGSNVLIVNLDISTGAFDKTWSEISENPVAFVYVQQSDGDARFPVSGVWLESGTYGINVMTDTGTPMQATTDSADGYPVAQTGG